MRQAIVLTFKNIRYLLDSCLPILDKGLRLLDKDFLAVLTTNRSALSECALVLPRVAGLGWVTRLQLARQECPRFREAQSGCLEGQIARPERRVAHLCTD